MQASPLVCQMAWPNLPHDEKSTQNQSDGSVSRQPRGRGVGKFNMVSQAQREAKARVLLIILVKWAVTSHGCNIRLPLPEHLRED